MKNFNIFDYGDSLKNPTFKGGGKGCSRETNIEGGFPKKGA